MCKICSCKDVLRASHSSFRGPCSIFTSCRSIPQIVGIVPSVQNSQVLTSTSILRSDHSLDTPKRQQCTMTSRRSIHIVGLKPSVLVLKTYRLSSQQAHPNQITVFGPDRIEAQLPGVHHMRTNQSTCRIRQRLNLLQCVRERTNAQPNNHTTNTFPFEEA